MWIQFSDMRNQKPNLFSIYWEVASSNIFSQFLNLVVASMCLSNSLVGLFSRSSELKPPALRSSSMDEKEVYFRMNEVVNN